jgi:hypothetical protein
MFIQASGKLVMLDLILKKLHEVGHRVLLFAQMTQTLDILQVLFLPSSASINFLIVSCTVYYDFASSVQQDFLELRQYTYERLDGSVRAEERFAAIKSFSSQPTKGVVRDDNQSGAFVFMISTRAGGVGLNLIGADTVSLNQFETIMNILLTKKSSDVFLYFDVFLVPGKQFCMDE